MHRQLPVTSAFLGILTVGVLLFALAPFTDLGRHLLYVSVAGIAMLLGFVAVRRRRPARPWGWLLVLTGMSTWVVGDVVWAIEQYGFGRDSFPAVSDAFYLGGYVGLGAGALLMVRTRRAGRDITALLDSLIIATGVAVVVTTFVIAPLAADSTVSTSAKLVSSFYPIGDLVLLAILARLWTTPGARTPSCILLTASIGVTLAVDLAWNIWLISGVAVHEGMSDRLSDTSWLAGYVLAAAAAAVPSMRTLAEPLPDREVTAPTARRLVALACGLMLPAIVLLIDGVRGNVDDLWPVIGVGMLVLTALIVVRMSGLIGLVQDQSARLAAVARADGLTGAPNRRTWDHELERSCEISRTSRARLCVGMIDLDAFKAYNDTHGHQAGDLLLREAVAAWTDSLGSRGTLARYGGEEFAVLLPGMTLLEATQTIDAMRVLTPSGQTFSAGVCLWDPTTEPGTSVAWADEALYQAKRTGRDRVVAYTGHAEGSATSTASQLPRFTVALQPIVRLEDGAVVAHEALSRFHDANDDVARVFTRAHAHGYGDLLEVAAINAALAIPGRPAHQDLFVNASPAALASERFWSSLPGRLDGVVVEIGELPTGVAERVLAEAVARLRSRGARIALDDVGSVDGARELTRLASLDPDVVKADRSVVAGCATDPAASAVLAALTAYASALGVVLCAEGVDDEADLRRLEALGVTHAQGYLLAEPGPAWHEEVATQRFMNASAATPSAAATRQSSDGSLTWTT